MAPPPVVPESTPWNEPSRRRRGRMFVEAIERSRSERAARDAFLEEQLLPGEMVVARSGDHPMVTDRRVLIAHPRRPSPPAGWTFESLPFADVTRWSEGRLHDGRPLLRLDHLPRTRIEHVPAHRFLSFEWGNAYGEIEHTTTTLGFGRSTDPVLVAIRDALEKAGTARGEPFEIRPAGTREERTRESHGQLMREYRPAALALHHCRLAWRVRTRPWWSSRRVRRRQ